MKKKFQKISRGLLLALAAAGMQFFMGTAIPPSASAETATPVTVGIPLPLSGGLKSFGIMMKNSFELAAEEINRDGGIQGRPLALVYADDRGEKGAALEAVRELSAAGAVMLVGGYASDPTYAMARAADDRNLPFLICTASADKITQVRLKNVYRLNPPISEYTQGLEDFFLKDLKPRSMAIVYEDSMFGTNAATSMMGFCRENAVEIRTLIGYPRETAEPAYMRRLLAPLTADPPDVVYMVSYLEDAVVLVREIQKLKIPSLLCGGAGGFTQPAFVEKAGAAADGMITAALWSRCSGYPGTEAYYQGYLERFGSEPDYHGVEAYSGLLVAADALKRAGALTSRNIRAALDATYRMTPFGPVKFYTYENFERQNTVRTIVLQVAGGRFRCIWPPDLAEAAFVHPKR
jgi:branched-chain amino acid transport system substrate-binding protein